MAHSQEKKWLETIPEEFQTLGSLVKDVKSIILHTLKSLEANQNPKAEQNETKMHVTKNQRNREHNVNKELEIIKRNQTDILEHKGVTDASWAELYPPPIHMLKPCHPQYPRMWPYRDIRTLKSN